MKLPVTPLIPLVVLMCFDPCLPQRASAQDKPGASGGRVVQDEKTFVELMHGTKWQCSINGAVVRFWFASSGLVIYERPGQSGTGAGAVVPVTIEKAGLVTWVNPGAGSRIFQLTVSKDLSSATLVDLGTKTNYPIKEVKSELMPEAEVSPTEYKEWLAGRVLDFPDAKYSFQTAGKVEVITPKDTTTHPYVIVHPGLVRIHLKGNRADPAIIAAGPGLPKERLWWSGGYKEGVAEKRVPELAQEKGGAEKETPGKDKEPAGTEKKSAEMEPASPSKETAGLAKKPDDGVATIAVKLNSTSVNALLIRELGGGKLAGSASALSLTSLPASGDQAGEVKFNQDVGEMMTKALKEVSRFHTLRQKGWPRGTQMELSFADKFTPKDGPSAAVACALLLESAFTGAKLDSAFAVTGDMNADGSVQPIGGVHAKLRGATRLKCGVLGIPEKNVVHATDIVITEGIKPFIAIQVFSLSRFDDALSLARTDKPADLAAAIADFSAIAQVLKKNPDAAKSPALAGKLQAILAKAPNHLSAKVLLANVSGQLPVRLSPAGTLYELRQCVGDLITGINSDQTTASKLDSNQLGKARGALQRLRPQADLRVKYVVDAYVDWAELAAYIIYEDEGLITKNTVGRWKAAVQRIKTEEEKLRKDESFSEDLE